MSKKSTEWRTVLIPKKSGGFRRIRIPPDSIMSLSRAIVPSLQAICLIMDRDEVMHGFLPGRSPITNAQKHIGFEYTISFDLEDFFDNVFYAQVTRSYSAAVSGGFLGRLDGVRSFASIIHFDDCFYDSRAAQGIPSSPLCANIAAWQMDQAILRYLREMGLKEGFSYTRYADDLAISFSPRPRKNYRNFHTNDLIQIFLLDIPHICKGHGFPVNDKKTKVQCAKAGRRIITGVGVDDVGVFPTREAKRKHRAARHQKTRSRFGLAEWCKVKPPRQMDLFKRIERSVKLSSDDRNFRINCQAVTELQCALEILEFRRQLQEEHQEEQACV